MCLSGQDTGKSYCEISKTVKGSRTTVQSIVNRILYENRIKNKVLKSSEKF